MPLLKGITKEKLDSIEDSILVSAEMSLDRHLIFSRADESNLDVGTVGEPQLPTVSSVRRYSSNVCYTTSEWFDSKSSWSLFSDSNYLSSIPSGAISSISFSSNGTDFAVTTASKIVTYLWNSLTERYNVRTEFTPPEGSPSNVVLDPTGYWCAHTIAASPYFRVYKRGNTGNFAALANPVTAVGSTITSIGVWGTTSEAYVALSVGSQIFFYKATTDGLVRLDSDITLPGAARVKTSWTFDGEYVAFTNAGDNGLTVLRRVGDNFSALEISDAEIGWTRYQATWSPDAKYLAVVSKNAGVSYIETYSFSGEVSERVYRTIAITSDPVASPELAWSPDSRYLFVNQNDDEFSLYRNLDGVLVRIPGGIPIDSALPAVSAFAFEPRGRSLVIAKPASDGLYVFRNDGHQSGGVGRALG